MSWTPAATGPVPIEIKATNGTLPDDTQSYSITVFSAPPPRVTQYSDDCESNTGWTEDPLGTDDATTGMWERANPQPTFNSFDGIDSQLGTTVSGSFDLVTEGCKRELAAARVALEEMLPMVGLEALLKPESAVDPDAARLLAERDDARGERAFERADQLRDELDQRGYEVRDGPDGGRLIRRS